MAGTRPDAPGARGLPGGASGHAARGRGAVPPRRGVVVGAEGMQHEPQPQQILPVDSVGDLAPKTLSVRRHEERTCRALAEKRAASALQARLADMPQATAEL